MGLSLTCSLEVLATRAQTSKLTVVLLVSFVKDSGLSDKLGECIWPLCVQEQHAAGKVVVLFFWYISECARSAFIMRLSCVFVYNAPPEVSHKVANRREHGQLCRDTNSVCMWDRITLWPCDWPALRQTSNKRQAKSIRDNNLCPRTLQCKQSGGLLWVDAPKSAARMPNCARLWLYKRCYNQIQIILDYVVSSLYMPAVVTWHKLDKAPVCVRLL